MNTEEQRIFAEMPVTRAVIKMSVPAIISQIISVVYNIADAFFLGQQGDPGQVAATSLCMPIAFMPGVISCLLGVGGAAFIARCAGMGQRERAEKGAAFGIYMTTGLAALLGAFVWLFRDTLLPFLGANEGTYLYCLQYSFWVVTAGAVPTALSMALSHYTRTEGFPKLAGYGIMGGAILNIILDPIFIFSLNMGIRGAAIATFLSNLAAMIFFLCVTIRHRKSTYINIYPKNFRPGGGLAKEIVMGGLPSAIMMFMAIVSNTVLNRLIVSYSNEAIAGMSIAKKVNSLAYAIANGLTQGVLPLIAFNYAAGNMKRMKEIIKTSFTIGLIISGALLAVIFFSAGPITRLFIDDAATVRFGEVFLKVICFSTPLLMCTVLIITIFQAVGEKRRPALLSLLSKGTIDVVLMLLLNQLIGMNGIAWATPVTDAITLFIALMVFIQARKIIFRET